MLVGVSRELCLSFLFWNTTVSIPLLPHQTLLLSLCWFSVLSFTFKHWSSPGLYPWTPSLSTCTLYVISSRNTVHIVIICRFMSTAWISSSKSKFTYGHFLCKKKPCHLKLYRVFLVVNEKLCLFWDFKNFVKMLDTFTVDINVQENEKWKLVFI